MIKKEQVLLNRLVKSLTWFSLILLLIFFLSIFTHQLTAFNQDLGRHLKIGEIIVNQQSIPKTNLFSYTFPDFPFLNHHWLAEVIFFLVNYFFNNSSLIFLKLIFFGLAFFSLVLIALKRFNKIIGLGWGLALLFLFNHRTDIRPEIFSYFFLSLYLIILSKKELFKQWFPFLLLIQVLWINTHIYFFLGPSLLFFYLINQTIGLRKIRNKKQEKKELIKTSVIFISSLITCLINPNFIQGALYPFSVFKNYGYTIVENQSFFFMSNYINRVYDPYFLVIFILLFFSFLITFKKQSFYVLASFIFFSILGFQAIRNIPVFSLGVFLSGANNLNLIKERLKIKFGFNSEAKLNFTLLFFFIFIPLLLFLNYQNIFSPASKKQLSDKKLGLGRTKGAEDGVRFILNNNISGPMFNNFDISGYLIYRLYPQYKVFVDNRPEAYPASFFQEIYIPIQNQEKKWQKAEKEYNFNFIFFSHTDITPWAISFLERISQDRTWQLVFLDDYVVIFLKNNDINKRLIEKYSLSQDNFSFQCSELDCSARLKRATNILGW